MFIKAINEIRGCVKPFVTSYKTPYNDELISNMYPIIMINDEGWALTTKTVASNIIIADKIHETYDKIKSELIENKVPPKKIYKKYKLNEDSPVILKNVFLDSVTSWEGLKIYAHDTLDLALIKFENPEKILCDKFPIFSSSVPQQGESLCKLCYPYYNINVFRYDHISKDIVLNEIGLNGFQIMPIDGIMTRYLKENNEVSLFEMSGYSFNNNIGGPVINKKGVIVGIQINSVVEDAVIDIETKLKRNLKEIEVKQYSFVPFSVCINSVEIMKFMNKYNINYMKSK